MAIEAQELVERFGWQGTAFASAGPASAAVGPDTLEAPLHTPLTAHHAHMSLTSAPHGTQTHTKTHTDTQTLTQTLTHRHTHRPSHTDTHTDSHTQTLTDTHRRARPYARASTRARKQAAHKHTSTQL